MGKIMFVSIVLLAVLLFILFPTKSKHNPTILTQKFLELDKIVSCEICGSLLFKDMAIKKQEIFKITSFFNIGSLDSPILTKGTGEYQTLDHYYCRVHGKDIKFKCPD